MEQKKKKIIFLSIGITAVLITILGVSYAYFITNITNTVGSSINVAFEDLGNIIFEDGNEITLNDTYPGTYQTKTFTIERTDATYDLETKYKVMLYVRENTLTDNADGEFVYSISGTKVGDGTLVSASNIVVPNVSSQIGSDGVFIGNGTHTYTFTIGINESGSNQNSTRGKIFNGYLNVISISKYAYSSVSDHKVSLTVDYNGGSANQVFENEYYSGERIYLTPAVKENYFFGGWMVTDGLIVDENILIIGKNSTTITAIWYNYNTMFNYNINGAAGIAGTDYLVVDDGNENWRIKFLTSGTFTPLVNMEIDTFLVGGGGSGLASNCGSSAGGGGGNTLTESGMALVKNRSYQITIGSGGASAAAGSYSSNPGSDTIAFGFTAAHGTGGFISQPSSCGGAGGSNGGGSSHPDAASNGQTVDNGSACSASLGQNATTCEFGQGTLADGCNEGVTMYSGGGGGAYSGLGGSGGGANVNVSAAANTGGGGGGGTWNGSSCGTNIHASGAGGSGIVIIRNTR